MGVNLMIGIHNHQPVGNFPWVFEDAYERSYGKFLDVLASHPEIRITIHNTGPLLDWIEANRPEYIEKLKGLAERGQVEIMGGAYYEPVISIIPEVDAVAQIEKMSAYIKKRFGKRPLGMWLAERVWEPNIPRITWPSGIKYTLLDDTHFRYSGLSDEELFGYYLTEHSGHTLAVFPIDRGLRYTIPFKEVNETIARLKEVSELKPDAGVTYGDDGEKFGVWPGTYDWVFEKGWMEDFFTALAENSNWINLMTFSEYMEKCPPAGRVYLSTANYQEMGEWALPPAAILKYKAVAEKIEGSDFSEDARPFIRGGFFKNFLTKYPESNNMQKRMCHVSRKLRSVTEAGDVDNKVPKAKLSKARDYLMAAQCNCAYWHGLFGGLYLNYLRHAVYENLCMAEKIIDGKDLPTLDLIDINADGAEEVLICTEPFTAYISPAEGGTLYHLDIRDFNFCITNTLARTFEAYHEEAKRSLNIEETEGEAPASIHDRMHIKEEGLLDILTYDRNRRYSFIDRIFESPPMVEKLAGESYTEVDGFSRGVYEVEKKGIGKDSVTVSLKSSGEVKISPEPFTLEIKKVYNVGVREPTLEVSYTLANLGSGEPTIYFAPELNFTLLGGKDPMRFVKYPGGEVALLNQRGAIDGIDRFSLVNEYDGFEVIVETTMDITLLHFGVETASQSEGGLERTYQGTAILPVFPVTLPEGKKQNIGIKISVIKVKGGKKVERKGV
jgi:alpha-amylase